MTQQAAELSPETVLEELKKNGVTHVVWLPDSETNWLYLLMQAEPTLDLITVSREGQAFSTAAGLAVGGAKPGTRPSRLAISMNMKNVPKRGTYCLPELPRTPSIIE